MSKQTQKLSLDDTFTVYEWRERFLIRWSISTLRI